LQIIKKSLAPLRGRKVFAKFLFGRFNFLRSDSSNSANKGGFAVVKRLRIRIVQNKLIPAHYAGNKAKESSLSSTEAAGLKVCPKGRKRSSVLKPISLDGYFSSIG
jgi:hypothetical protein